MLSCYHFKIVSSILKMHPWHLVPMSIVASQNSARTLLSVLKFLDQTAENENVNNKKSLVQKFATN